MGHTYTPTEDATGIYKYLHWHRKVIAYHQTLKLTLRDVLKLVSVLQRLTPAANRWQPSTDSSCYRWQWQWSKCQRRRVRSWQRRSGLWMWRCDNTWRFWRRARTPCSPAWGRGVDRRHSLRRRRLTRPSLPGPSNYEGTRARRSSK